MSNSEMRIFLMGKLRSFVFFKQIRNPVAFQRGRAVTAGNPLRLTAQREKGRLWIDN